MSYEERAGVMDKQRPKRPTTLDLFPRRQAQTGSQVGDWEGPAEGCMGGSATLIATRGYELLLILWSGALPKGSWARPPC